MRGANRKTAGQTGTAAAVVKRMVQLAGLLCVGLLPLRVTAAAERAVEEVIVEGHLGLREARAAITAAEDLFFARWNEINGDDDLDIECRMEAETGTRFKRRVCAARFFREARQREGQDRLYNMQTGNTFVASAQAEIAKRNPELKARMSALVKEDRELAKLLREREQRERHYRQLRDQQFQDRLIVIE